jgi:hypothetical protein
VSAAGNEVLRFGRRRYSRHLAKENALCRQCILSLTLSTRYEETWASWFGSGNNAVYNAVDYGLSLSDDVGTDNQTALQAAGLFCYVVGATGRSPSKRFTLSERFESVLQHVAGINLLRK